MKILTNTRTHTGFVTKVNIDINANRFIKTPFFSKNPSIASSFKNRQKKNKILGFFVSKDLVNHTMFSGASTSYYDSYNQVNQMTQIISVLFANKIGIPFDNFELMRQYMKQEQFSSNDVYNKLLINSIVTDNFEIMRDILNIYQDDYSILTHDDIKIALYAAINYEAFLKVKYILSVFSNSSNDSHKKLPNDFLNDLLNDLLNHALDLFPDSNKKKALRNIIHLIIIKYDPCDQKQLQSMFSMVLGTNDPELINLFVRKLNISSQNISNYLIWTSINPENLHILCQIIPEIKFHDHWTINAITNYDPKLLIALFENGFDTSALIKGGYTITDYINCLLDSATDEKKIILRRMREIIVKYSELS
jgi:hypothetical protein